MPFDINHHLMSTIALQCVKVCEKAVEVGRENRADFKLIAKAWARYQDFLFKDRSVVFE